MKFQAEAGGLRAGGVHPRHGVGRMFRLGVSVKSGHEGAPYVAQVDAGAAYGARAVGVAVINVVRSGVGGCFGRKSRGRPAVVGEGVGYAPLHLLLAHVGRGLVAQGVFKMPEQAVFKLAELAHHVGLFGPEQGGAAVKVAVSAAAPGAFGQGEHGGIKVVFLQYLRRVVNIPVVPYGQYAAGHVGIAAVLSADA